MAQRATVPEVGSTVNRADQEWVVTEIESETDDLTVAVLRRAPRTATHDVA